VDRISAVILGFGLPAIFIFMVWATAGSIYAPTSSPPPRPAAGQAEEEVPPSETAAAESVAAEEPAEDTVAETGASGDAEGEQMAAADTAEEAGDPAPETADAGAATSDGPAPEAAEEEGASEEQTDETAEAEAPAEESAEAESPAEETEEAEAPAEETTPETADAAAATDETAAQEADGAGGGGIDLAALVEAGDPRAGSRIWRQCSACHVADQEQNRVGPHLVDVIGREKASVEGFRYSDALTELEGRWTPDDMSAWLEDPRGYAPGNRMSFNGLSDAQDRADLLAYLADLQMQNGS